LFLRDDKLDLMLQLMVLDQLWHLVRYVKIAEELNTYGVSPYYVGTIWRKHKQDILDTVNRDLVNSRLYRAVAVAVRFLLLNFMQR